MKKRLNWPLVLFTASCAVAIGGGSYVAISGTNIWLRIVMLALALANAALLTQTLTRMMYTFRRYPMWRSIIDSVNQQIDESGASSGKIEIMLRVTAANGQEQPEPGDTGRWVN